MTSNTTPTVRKGGKRFYIVRDNDQPVVRLVPVGVCAAPPRVELHGAADNEPQHGPTCPAPIPADVAERHGLNGRVRRVRDVVRHPLGARART